MSVLTTRLCWSITALSVTSCGRPKQILLMATRVVFAVSDYVTFIHLIEDGKGCWIASLSCIRHWLMASGLLLLLLNFFLALESFGCRSDEKCFLVFFYLMLLIFFHSSLLYLFFSLRLGVFKLKWFCDQLSIDSGLICTLEPLVELSQVLMDLLNFLLSIESFTDSSNAFDKTLRCLFHFLKLPGWMNVWREGALLHLY